MSIMRRKRGRKKSSREREIKEIKSNLRKLKEDRKNSNDKEFVMESYEIEDQLNESLRRLE